MKYNTLIKQTFIGHYLTDNEINTARKTCNFSIKSFRKGEFLHRVGDDCSHLEILLEGTIVNMQYDAYGNELIIKSFEIGEIIAGNIIFGSSSKYPLSFFSQSNGTLLQIDKSFLFELFIKNPAILKQFLKLISDRAIYLGNKITHCNRKTLKELIMEYLHFQSLLQNSTTITLSISKKELADRLGVQRTSVSREFSRMQKDGLIILYEDKKTIKIMEK